MNPINVDLGDGRIFPMEAHLLDGPHFQWVDNDRERTRITVYKYRGKIVHRSVDVQLKQGIGVEAVLGRIG